MCGIGGVIDFSGSVVDPAAADAMAESLKQRGPDDQGIIVDIDNHWLLVHRRLAVIDPDHAAQPMSDPAGVLWITYNGECYNFQALRKELIEQHGCVFSTQSDTEVVLRLYEVFGVHCVDHMDGMFAFAVWDSRKKQLFLARDRMGQKPIFYALMGRRFVFGSTCRTVIAGGIPARMDPRAVGAFLCHGYVPGTVSGYAGIAQLPPGHYMVLRKEDERPKPVRYWQLPEAQTTNLPWKQAVRDVRHAVRQAVTERLVADVPLGTFVSGGLDSAIVSLLADAASEHGVMSCSMGFANRRYDERHYSHAVAGKLRGEHYVQVVHNDPAQLPADIEQLVEIYDGPFADSSALPTARLCRQAREHMTVVLSGDGADECAGGYDRYRALRMLRRWRVLWTLAKALGGGWIHGREHHSRLHRLERFFAAVNEPVDRAWLRWVAMFDPDQLADMLEPGLAMASPVTWDYFARRFDRDDTIAEVTAAAMASDMTDYLPGDINVKVDRASMAVGLEVRCPFQDHHVVELLRSLPTAWLCGGGGKGILRQAFADMVPPSVLKRPKMGFGVPVGHWFRGPLKTWGAQVIFDEDSAGRAWLDTQALKQLWNEHQAGFTDHGHRLWAVMMLNLWAKNALQTYE